MGFREFAGRSRGWLVAAALSLGVVGAAPGIAQAAPLAASTSVAEPAQAAIVPVQYGWGHHHHHHHRHHHHGWGGHRGYGFGGHHGWRPRHHGWGGHRHHGWGHGHRGWGHGHHRGHGHHHGGYYRF